MEEERNSEKRATANFETAISAAGFGRYNLILMLIIFPAGWANSFESVTMSYVFPAAQCDLNLSLEDKGLLNAITYTGMISSAIIWGFLFDTLGRRKLLMIGYFLDFLCVLISGFSQTKEMLIASKFFGGFIINGPYAAFSTYISEFHCARNRGRMQLFISISFCIGGIVLPWVVWAVLSSNLHFSIIKGFLEFHSWNILLLICSLPSLITSIIFVFMPESPKFLMTVGENEKALELFKKIYSFNSGNPPETFPIDHLVDEIQLKKTNPNRHGGHVTAKRSQSEALKEGFQQVKPLFFPPHLEILLLVCLIQALSTMNINTLRLWLPQIFQALNDYLYYTGESSADLCRSLEMIQPSNSTSECVFNEDNMSVYLNTTIVSFTGMLGQILITLVINKIKKKTLLFILGILCGGCVFTIYFAMNTNFAVTFSALYSALAAGAANVVVVVVIDLFPTTLRTLAVSLALMCGRLGSIIGNLLFPLLVEVGCAPPFFTIGGLIIVCAFLSLFLPNSEKKNLE